MGIKRYNQYTSQLEIWIQKLDMVKIDQELFFWVLSPLFMSCQKIETIRIRI